MGGGGLTCLSHCLLKLFIAQQHIISLKWNQRDERFSCIISDTRSVKSEEKDVFKWLNDPEPHHYILKAGP